MAVGSLADALFYYLFFVFVLKEEGVWRLEIRHARRGAELVIGDTWTSEIVRVPGDWGREEEDDAWKAAGVSEGHV